MAPTELLIGDPAPELRLGEMLKGERITHFTPGRIYLVECWATWCGPCLNTIPHLTELQAAHPELTVVGISVHEDDVEEVRAFVTEKGDAMGYTVAMDDRGEEGGGGWMPEAWLAPTYQEGIPAAFLVDREGRIAWFGHPDAMDEVLPQLLAGTYDLPAAAAAYQNFLAEEMVRESTEMMREMDRHLGAEDQAGALQAMDRAFLAHPRLETLRGVDKLALLLRSDTDAAIAYSHRLADEVSPDSAGMFMDAGRVLVDAAEEPGNASAAPALAARALDMLQAAVALGTDGETAFQRLQMSRNLARALIACGRPAEARPHAQAALDVALAEGGLPNVFLDRLRALVQSCPAQAKEAKKAAPIVVCDGNTCRIVA